MSKVENPPPGDGSAAGAAGQGQRAGTAVDLRRKLFSSFTFDEVANLSAIRFELFPEAVGPACVVMFRRVRPVLQDTFLYFYPKPLRDEQAEKRFIIEPQDVNEVTHAEAGNDPLVWVTLALGTRRDLELVRRLTGLPSLAKLHADAKVLKREGIIRGMGSSKEENGAESGIARETQRLMGTV